MRPWLVDPVAGDPRLPEVQRIAAELYALHEAGRPTHHGVQRLAALVGGEHGTLRYRFIYAFGSVSPETFARQLLVNVDDAPRDLSREELLELIERISNPRHDEEFLTEVWLICLRLNTSKTISDLIFWPGDYFGDGDQRTELTHEQILDWALSGSRTRPLPAATA